MTPSSEPLRIGLGCGPDHPALADLRFDTCDFATAETLYRRVLDGRDRTLGRTHPSTLASADDLAVVYATMGNDADAEPLFRRVLEHSLATLSPNDPNLCRVAFYLAVIYEAQNEVSKALPIAEHVLKSFTKTLGVGHEKTIRVQILVDTLKNPR